MTAGSDRWDFTELFADETALNEALKELKSRAEALGAWRERLEVLDAEGFLELIKALEAFTDLAHRVYAYAALRFYENSLDENAQALFSRVRAEVSELSTKTLFFEIWWKNLPEDRARPLIAAAGERYRYWLEEMRAWRPHTLSEEAERAITLKNVTAKAPPRIYATLSDRYEIRFEAEGEPVKIRRSELAKYVQDPRPEVRRAAYDAALERFQDEAIVLGELYRLVVQDWGNEYLKLRGFKRPIQARNKINDLPDEVVEAVLSAAHEHRGVFQDYFRLKARALGQSKLSRYDLYAPVTREEKAFSFDEALALVEKAFSRFDPEFARLMRRVVEARHIDVYPREGKRSGAFSYGPAPGLTPYLLLNFQGRPRDVATLAHELGHAIHALLAADHPVFTFHAPLPLAEMASTFAEMLLVDLLLEEAGDPALKAQILFDQLDDHYATIQRQAYFAHFEIEAHDALYAGKPIEAAHDAYFKTLKDQFGDAVELPEAFRFEWMMVPHFFNTPFYVYAYSFGQLLVLSLYARFREEGKAFIPRLKRLLAAGGSKPPVELLKSEGFEVADPGFWRKGYGLIAENVRTLKTLL